MSILICPNCKENLNEYDDCFRCASGHSFDKAKQGYVNLALSQKSSHKRHGDDHLMIKARTDFLSGGYYKPLLDVLCNTVAVLIANDGVILDCGCGEGYYTEGIYNSLSHQNKHIEMYGNDISKDAIIAAGRRSKDISLFVSSISQLPVRTNSVNIITDIFAPHCDTEFYRVLKKHGTLIRVIPLEKHLFSLKKAIYDTPYLNVPDMPPLFGFTLSNRQDVIYDFNIEGKQLQNLFMMTPYYYKTSEQDQNKLKNIQFLTTTAEFAVLTYEKV